MKQIFVIFLLSLSLFTQVKETCGIPQESIDETVSKKKSKDRTKEHLSSRDAENERIFIEAERMKMLGQYEGAIDLFLESTKLDSKNDAAYFELARLYYASKQDDKALAAIMQAVKLSPSNLWYNLVYAQVLVAKEQDKTAILVYNKVLELAPYEIAYYYDKAQLFERVEQIDSAIGEYDLIEQRFGIDEYVVDEKKRLYLSINQVDKAIGEVQKLINEDAQNPDYYHMIAEIYAVNKETDKAKQAYASLLQKFPDYPFALLALADYAYQEGDRKTAINYTIKAFSNKDFSIDSKIKILYQYIQYKDTKKNEISDAYQLANALIATHPSDPKSYAITGDLYQTNGNDSMALVQYEKAISLREDVFSVWQQLLFILSDQQNYTKLQAYTTRAITLFPKESLPYFFDGVAKDNNKSYDSAIIDFQTAIKLSAANNILKAQILASLGDTYHKLKMNVSSDSCYEKAIKLDPSNAYAMNNYSYYLSLRNEFLEKAKEYSAKSISIDKSNPSYMDTYAWILYQLKEYKSAKEWQEKALRYSDLSDPVMFEHYGDILFQLGDLDNAVKSWMKAKEKGNSSSLLDKKIANKKLYE